MSPAEGSIDQLSRFWSDCGLSESRRPEAMDAVQAYWRIIQEHNDRAGLVSPATAEADFHLKHAADSLALLHVRPDLLSGPVDLADLGSGAGLPGLILAIALPELRITAIESNGKKAEFIALAAEGLGLARRVSVARGRSRELARTPGFRGRFSIVVARAVASVDTLIREGRGLLSPDGSMVLYKTPAALSEVIPLAQRRASRHNLEIVAGEAIHLPADAGTRVFVTVSRCRDADEAG